MPQIDPLAKISLKFFGLFILIATSVHVIPEGYVGVYYRAGKLLPKITEPGLQVSFPFVTVHESVQVTLQTDEVLNVECGTSGGIIIIFSRIEVVNILEKNSVYDIVKNYTVKYDKPLIYDKIHHELNQYCSVHTLQQIYIDEFDKIDDYLKQTLQRNLDQVAPGLSIIAVRVTKPKIPDAIGKNYELMEMEKTKLMISAQHQKVVQMDAETEYKRAVKEAEKEAAITSVDMRRKLEEKRALKEMAQIESEIFKIREKGKADAGSYASLKQAEANKILLTREYVEFAKYEAIVKNAKIIFSPLGSVERNFFFSDLNLEGNFTKK